MTSLRNTPAEGAVLLVDDDEEASKALIRALQRAELPAQVTHVSSAQECLHALRSGPFSAAVVDLELIPGKGPSGGLELLSEITALDPTLRCIVLTGHDCESTGIEALRRGAASFLAKPADVQHLRALIEDAIRTCSLRRRLSSLEEQLESTLPEVGFATQNREMKRVFEEIRFAASMNQPVLILGETGTGKGVVARAIHQMSSPGKPFVRAQPTYGNFNLVQSELFGHDRGAFTGALHERKGLIEEAHGGTLFLDEIDALPRETQVLLLDVLQEKNFRRIGSSRERKSSFRLIAATNRSKSELTDVLRQDLYHRIAHQIIELPPLRQRREDIEPLATTLLRDVSEKERLLVSQLAPDAIQKLLSYPWPGNIRELSAIIQQAAYRARFAGRAVVTGDDLPLAPSERGRTSFRERVLSFEASLLRDALRECSHNISETARSLGIERTQLRRMLKRHKLL